MLVHPGTCAPMPRITIWAVMQQRLAQVLDIDVGCPCAALYPDMRTVVQRDLKGKDCEVGSPICMPPQGGT